MESLENQWPSGVASLFLLKNRASHALRDWVACLVALTRVEVRPSDFSNVCKVPLPKP